MKVWKEKIEYVENWNILRQGATRYFQEKEKEEQEKNREMQQGKKKTGKTQSKKKK